MVRLTRLRSYWVGISAFTKLLRANAAATRRLNEQLVAEHGLTVEEYEILVRIARTRGMRMRQLELAEQQLLTAANATRVLDGLEQGKLVNRNPSAGDGGVVYVTLTDVGRTKVRAATANHGAQVEELFGSLFDDEESVGELLLRLAKAAG